VSDRLPRELLLRDGHLTDIAASTLADGEASIVPDDVVDHVRTCEACAALVRGEALQSVALGELLREASAEPEPERVASVAPGAIQRPAIAIAAGIALSIAGALMGVASGTLSIGDRLRDIRDLIVLLVRGLRAALSADLPPALSFASTALLLAVALLIIRTSPLARASGSNRPVSS
jgi:predicted anti-sigma-YlaC factor YlaD